MTSTMSTTACHHGCGTCIGDRISDCLTCAAGFVALSADSFPTACLNSSTCTCARQSLSGFATLDFLCGYFVRTCTTDSIQCRLSTAMSLLGTTPTGAQLLAVDTTTGFTVAKTTATAGVATVLLPAVAISGVDGSVIALAFLSSSPVPALGQLNMATGAFTALSGTSTSGTPVTYRPRGARVCIMLC